MAGIGGTGMSLAEWEEHCRTSRASAYHEKVRKEFQSGHFLVDVTRLSSRGDSLLHRNLNIASAASCVAAATEIMQKLLSKIDRETGGHMKSSKVIVLKSAKMRCLRPLPCDREVWIAVRLASVKKDERPGYYMTAHIYNEEVSSVNLTAKGKHSVRLPAPYCEFRARLVAIDSAAVSTKK